MSIKKKNGYLTTCKSIFRMNYRVDKCLEVFGAFTFDLNTLGQKEFDGSG